MTISNSGGHTGVAADVVATLREVLARESGGQLQIEGVAGLLGLSVRTLQRRLAERGLSYTMLRDRVLLEAACQLLNNSDVRLIDIAYRLGYSDPGHFTRAFQGWMGIAPRRFREQIRDGCDERKAHV